MEESEKLSHQYEGENIRGPEEGEVREGQTHEIEAVELQRIKNEVEGQELSRELKEEAQKDAQNLQFLEESERVKKLLEIAKKKGVIPAVHAAMKMEGFDVDALHDVLAKDGFYKEFLK